MKSPNRSSHPKFLTSSVLVCVLFLPSFAVAASGEVAFPKAGDTNSITLVLFWIAAILLAYVCVGYPLAVGTRAALAPHPWKKEALEPMVSIVIAAHNEAPNIKRKVRNLLAQEYPADRIEILVCSDGSTDGTLQKLRSISAAHIRIFVLPDRQGKPTVLNMLMDKAVGEIVVLADARQEFEPQLLRTLVRSFADPQVGAVSGELTFTRDATSSAVGDGTGVYWRYEEFIRHSESRLDSTVGATGPVYAIRKSLFEPIPHDTILDDVLIPVRIARRGYRVVFEPDARASVRAPATIHEEFARKVRTLAGNFQVLWRERWLFNPLTNRLWWQTISHKVLRLFIPLLQVALFATNIFLLSDSVFYRLALAVQVLFYGGAAAGWILQRSQKKFWPATFPFMFCLLSWATVVGFLRWFTGRQSVRWEKAGSPAIR